MGPALSFIVGIVGNVVSILFFASPMKTFWEVVKKKSTDEYEVVPYVTTFLCTNLWFFYGFRKPGGLLLVTVNGAGAILEFIYITLFLIYSPRHKKVKTAKLFAVLNIGCLGSAIAVILLLVKPKKQLKITGILCSALSIAMYASPLSAMRMVIKTKSVDYMPFLLSFSSFINAAIWTLYAALADDFFLLVPNVIGMVLGSAQMILYSIYKKKSNSSEVQKHVNKMSQNDGDTIEMTVYKEHSKELKEVEEIRLQLEDRKQVVNNYKNKSLPTSPVDHHRLTHSLEKSRRTLSCLEPMYGSNSSQRQGGLRVI